MNSLETQVVGRRPLQVASPSSWSHLLEIVSRSGDPALAFTVHTSLLLPPVIPITEVTLARAPRALEGEVRGGSSLVGAGKGRLWRKGSHKGGRLRRAARQRALIPSFLPVIRRPSSITTSTAPPTKTAAVLMTLLGGQECRVKMTSLRSSSTPLIPYPAQQCQPSASESSAVQRSSLPLRETSCGRTLLRRANA